MSITAISALLISASLVGAKVREEFARSQLGLRYALIGEMRRDALLKEAQAALRQALRVGEPGRFTGQVFGSYQLGVVLGCGGMGEVYAAVHTETQREAAVKLLRHEILSQSRMVARFEQEAKIIRGIHSPHVVEVFEIGGPEAPLPYIAMERLEGEDLAEKLGNNGAMPLPQASKMIQEVAAGLGAIHAAGVVHRDLKHHNLFHMQNTSGGAVWKILDFGVSFLQGESQELTQGLAVGTPAYMSPEQALGGETDARTDVCALACIIYRALTNQPAFSGEPLAELFARIASDMPVDPGESYDLPVQVAAVLRVGLAKLPTERFASAAELATHFAQAAGGRLDAAVTARAKALNQKLPWRQPDITLSRRSRPFFAAARGGAKSSWQTLKQLDRSEARTLPN